MTHPRETAKVEKRRVLTRRNQRVAAPRSPINPGDRFNRWTVLGLSHKTPSRNAVYLCRCACGVERAVPDTRLRDGTSTSCGCALRDRMAESARHSHCVGGKSSPEHRSWASMKGRCSNPNDPSFEHYGGRGIAVCERWTCSFEAFLADMGSRPSLRHSIERLDPDGDYTPTNCVWATPTQQARNKRSTPRLTLNGKTLTSHEWAPLVGVSAILILSRKNAGWSDEDALTQPLRPGSRPGGRLPLEKRRRLTKLQALQLALEQSGRCGCGCGQKLSAMTEGVVDEHVIPLALGGSNDMSNRRLYRRPCALRKTAQEDVPAIAKCRRIEARENGTRRPRKAIPQRAEPMQGQGFSKTLVRGFDGKVRPRAPSNSQTNEEA